jgi:hypothetical protein
MAAIITAEAINKYSVNELKAYLATTTVAFDDCGSNKQELRVRALEAFHATPGQYSKSSKSAKAAKQSIKDTTHRLLALSTELELLSEIHVHDRI